MNVETIQALIARVGVDPDIFDAGKWTFTMPKRNWLELVRSREYAHRRAVAVRAAWCARQSPKAWPKRLAPGESAYNPAAPGAWLGLDRVPR